ncbi:hypothetical protein [Streptomyces cremeus]|uniref:PASTA domain-containing protein n=1 Tax=Streptomyces cremeus TaxID=66881 RepID=A0ABV5PDS6_STRCM
MHHRHTALALTAAALLALTACQDVSTGDASKPNSTGPASSAAPGPSAPRVPAEKDARLPDFVGKGLQSAQDQAQAAGFYALKSHDALGRGRQQVLDRSWKVCSQTPAAGTRPTSTTVDFGTVKLEESCPDADVREPDRAGGTMPNLVGKSVKVARESLPANTSLTVEDSSGRGRMVLVESNWSVCSVTPGAGTALDGQPVTISAAKFTESC